ncbi:hypothetical protein K388_07099 [Streptomyces sp. KhCrAH-43]|uniref:hypothetical protein n=1 Tax=unclassified Streptomyces TaxID=2593676 RepID=UPI00035E5E19|nr:hypothetical protein [Streptomyces sp. KhCrAH-43]MYS32904.1 hypothetical protein [Streptomyces sp. SID4920]MYX64110.1 hypothetical protein [Streptomyces sp. SID8373]RAJ47862.1 hypothetical protein K388_07099 [Streptomyces sp. KhCrAH-43]
MTPEILMDTREGKSWNTFFMHLTSATSTMNMHIGEGGWSLHEVYHYVLRRLERGDYRFREESARLNALAGWRGLVPDGLVFIAYNGDLHEPCVFGVYEYEKIADPAEDCPRIAQLVSEEVSTQNNWLSPPTARVTDYREFTEVSLGVLDMRLDLLAASTGEPRRAAPIGSTTRLLAWDDAVSENFEYLLRIQSLPGITQADHREASHLLYRLSLHRWSLMDRIERDGIHVESDPDLAVGSRPNDADHTPRT